MTVSKFISAFFTAILFVVIFPLQSNAQCGGCPDCKVYANTTFWQDYSCANPNNHATIALTGSDAGLSAPFIYGWQDENGNSGSVTTSALAYTWNNLPGGLISFWVIDFNGSQKCEWHGTCYWFGGFSAVADGLSPDCGQTSGTIWVSVYGGSDNYTYNWSNGSTGWEQYNVLPGTYTVTITDYVTTCTASATVTINPAPPTPTATISVTNAYCGEANGSATVQTNASKYLWSNGAKTKTITGLVAGTYSVTVTNEEGCTKSANCVIQNIGTPVFKTVNFSGCTQVVLPNGQIITASSSTQINYTGQSGCDSLVTYNVEITNNGGHSFQYFSGCESVMLPSGYVTLHDSTYTLLVPSASGCVDTVTIIAKVYEPVTITNKIKACGPIMIGGTTITSDVTLTQIVPGNPCFVTEITEISFSDPDTIPVTISMCGSFSQFSYVAYTTDPISGCTNHIYPTTVLPIQKAPTVYDTIDVCKQSLATTKLIENPGCEANILRTFKYVPLPTVNDTVKVCDYTIPEGSITLHLQTVDGLCDSTVNKVTLHLPKAPLEIAFAETCDSLKLAQQFESVVTNDCNPNKLLIWKETHVVYKTVQKTTCNPVDTGIVVMHFKNDQGCDTLVRTTVISYQSILETSTEQTICFGEVYHFNGKALTSSGVYRDTLTSFYGCDSISVIYLTVLPKSVGYESQVLCYGSSLVWHSQTITQPGTYTAITGIGHNGCDSLTKLQVNFILGQTIPKTKDTCNLLVAGQVIVTYQTSPNGCTDTLETTLVYKPSSVDVFSKDTCVQNVPSVTDTIADGNCFKVRITEFCFTPYQDIRDSVTCDTFLANTLTYSDILDSNGCVTRVWFNWKLLHSSSSSIFKTICFGESYVFGNQELTLPGTYKIVLTNMTGCDSTIVLNLDVLAKPIINLGSVQPGCGENMGKIWVTAQSANTDLFWSNPTIVTGDTTFVAAGEYSVTVIDANGCEATDSVIINPAPASVSVTLQTVWNCPDSTGLVTSVVTGGNGDYVYNWNGSWGVFNTPAIDSARAGFYAVTVTDGNGCTAAASTVLNSPICPVECEVELFRVGNTIRVVVNPKNGGHVDSIDWVAWVASQGNRFAIQNGTFTSGNEFFINIPQVNVSDQMFVITLPTIVVDGKQFELQTASGGNAFCIKI